jgi:hypothetical protein
MIPPKVHLFFSAIGVHPAIRHAPSLVTDDGLKFGILQRFPDLLYLFAFEMKGLPETIELEKCEASYTCANVRKLTWHEGASNA